MTLPLTHYARRILALALMLILPALLLLAACGGDDEGGSGSDATATRAAETDGAEPSEDEPSSTEDSGGNGGGGGSDIDACALLTDAEVEAVLGVSVEGVPEEDVEPIKGCRWEPEGLLLVAVSVFKGSKDEVAAFYEISEASSDAVEGIGDKAQYNDFVKSIEVLVDDETDVAVVVVNADIDEKQAAIALAEKVIDRLP